MTWLRRDRAPGALVLLGLVGFVSAVYVMVVLGGGLLIGHTSSPHLGLSILATALVAWLFERVQRRLESLATRWLRGGRPSPYEALNRLSSTAAGTYASDEIASRMARVLAEGTGAAWTQVWLVIAGRPTLAATWPAQAAADDSPPFVAVGHGASEQQPGRRSMPVRHAGEVLAVLRVQEHPRQALTPVEERLFAGLAGQAGLVLRGALLQAERAQQASELAGRVEELQQSRERLVDAQDEERRRLERDIHDGAQQHLVAMAVNVRLAATMYERAPGQAAKLLGAQRAAIVDLRETLANLSRGLYPRLLTEHGVASALRAAVTGSAVPVVVDAPGVGRQHPDIEAAVYFASLEAVQNAAKHSGARHIDVALRVDGDRLVVTVEDDGSGFGDGPVPAGTGLANMRDRIDSVGGQLSVSTGRTGGALIRTVVPAIAVPSTRQG